ITPNQISQLHSSNLTQINFPSAYYIYPHSTAQTSNTKQYTPSPPPAILSDHTPLFFPRPGWMGRRRRSNRGASCQQLDLRLNLSPLPNDDDEESAAAAESMCSSWESSCVSEEEGTTTAPAAARMMVVGCPRCLMYVMLSEVEPKCPKCKSSVLLHDFLNRRQQNPAAAGIRN
ncbi:unnamed protein product, partial [Linum tenue]